MYPYTSYQGIVALQEERLGQMEEMQLHPSLAQQLHPAARFLAHSLGHALVALGNRLELFGR